MTSPLCCLSRLNSLRAAGCLGLFGPDRRSMFRTHLLLRVSQSFEDGPAYVEAIQEVVVGELNWLYEPRVGR